MGSAVGGPLTPDLCGERSQAGLAAGWPVPRGSEHGGLVPHKDSPMPARCCPLEKCSNVTAQQVDPSVAPDMSFWCCFVPVVIWEGK